MSKITDKEIEQLLKDSNEVLRSCFSIIERKGESTNWESIKIAVEKVLKEQHQVLCNHDFKCTLDTDTWSSYVCSKCGHSQISIPNPLKEMRAEIIAANFTDEDFKLIDPATPESTANLSKIGDKHYEPKNKAEIKTISDYALILEHCNGYSKSESKKAATESHGEELFDKLLKRNTKLFGRGASFVNERKDNVGVNDAVEFADWISGEGYQQYDGVGRWIAPQNNNNVYSTKELYQQYLQSLK